MKIFRGLICCLLLIGAVMGYSQDVLQDHQQLLVVTSQDWNTLQARLQRYERTAENGCWTPIGNRIPIVLGKTGLAWGIGLQPCPVNRTIPVKKEGDGKSPAGIFTIGPIFGFPQSSAMGHLRVEYLQIDEATEAVDDPSSVYYNCIVDNLKVPCDWNSSEKMAEISLYELGFVVNHNYPNPQPGKGSAIFFHLWPNENSGTAGCTAMERENLNQIVCWLDERKNPVLVQLPVALYNELKGYWELPNLE